MAEASNETRELIRAALLAARMPRSDGQHIFAGYGEFVPCACCGRTITAAEIQYDIEWPEGADIPALAMHVHCFDAWRKESAALPRHIFQIAYDEQLLAERGRLLRGRGYAVTTVLGNDAAKAVLLNRSLSVDVFVLGHAAPVTARLEMVEWLRAHYPGVRIVALNPAEREQLGDLRFNAAYNSPPEQWMPLLAAAM